MKDALGNELAPGQLVLWNTLIAKVSKVMDGRLTTKDPNPPTVVLELALQNPDPRTIMRVVDPNAEKLLESAMGAP